MRALVSRTPWIRRSPTNPAAFDSLFSFKEIPDKRNFAPRLGLAYAPRWGRFLFGDGKTVLRAGYGIFYDGLFTNITDQTAESQPNTFGGSIASPTGRGAQNASTFPGITLFNSSLLITTMASNLHNPLTQQWNVDVQRELPLGLVLTLAYVGTRGEHLFANQDFNPQVNFSFMNPNFGEIEVRTNAGDSWYNSGQVEVERRVRTLVLRAAYTYSKFLDDASDVNFTTGFSTFSQDLTNQRSDWGPSAFDRRHRFTAAYVWQVPHSHQNAFLRALTDAWEWSGMATIESGTPNTVSLGFDNIGNGHPNSRPDLVNPSAPTEFLRNRRRNSTLGVPGCSGTLRFQLLVFRPLLRAVRSPSPRFISCAPIRRTWECQAAIRSSDPDKFTSTQPFSAISRSTWGSSKIKRFLSGRNCLMPSTIRIFLHLLTQ